MSCVSDHKRGSGCIILKDDIVVTIDRSDRIKETKDLKSTVEGRVFLSIVVGSGQR